MKVSEYKDNMYVTYDRTKTATIYITKDLEQFRVKLIEADAPHNAPQYVDITCIEPATSEQLSDL